MKKISLLLILIFGMFSQAFSQQAKVTAILHFSGTVATYPIEMTLEIAQQSDSVSGSYFYLKSGSDKRISLSGTIKDGVMKLTEESFNQSKRVYQPTGSFKLNYVGQTSLNGVWQKDITSTPKQLLSVRLNCKENLKMFNPLSYTFQFSQNKVKLETISENADPYYQILLIKIFVNKSIRWLFSDFDETSLARKAEIELEDLNFDGLLDFKVPIYFPNRTKGDFAYLYFIYDPLKKGFAQHKQLNGMEHVFFDPIKKEVLKVIADGNGNENYSYYHWFNKKLLIKSAIQLYENDPYSYHTAYRIENGKAVKIKTTKKK